MAEENDDVTEPVDAEVSGSESGPTSADATVSVAPFIDDDDESDDGAPSVEPDDDDDEESPVADGASKSAVGAAVATSKAKSDKAKPTGSDDDAPKVTRRVVTSKRVTPKGGGSQKPSGPKKAKGKHDDEDDEGFRSARYTPPGGQGAYAQGPSPWWVPALLFGCLIIGALIIMLNYMGVFGDAQNVRLVIGLAFILAGILTSTQYR